MSAIFQIRSLLPFFAAPNLLRLTLVFLLEYMEMLHASPPGVTDYTACDGRNGTAQSTKAAG